jgi:hypothetical protein
LFRVRQRSPEKVSWAEFKILASSATRMKKAASFDAALMSCPAGKPVSLFFLVA